LDYFINITQEQKRFNNPNIIGSELTKRNDEGVIIQKINRFKVFSKQVDPLVISPDILAEFT
jgi:hypothetical protein